MVHHESYSRTEDLITFSVWLVKFVSWWIPRMFQWYHGSVRFALCRQQPEELGYIFKRYPVCLLHKSKRRHWWIPIFYDVRQSPSFPTRLLFVATERNVSFCSGTQRTSGRTHRNSSPNLRPKYPKSTTKNGGSSRSICRTYTVPVGGSRVGVLSQESQRRFQKAGP